MRLFGVKGRNIKDSTVSKPKKAVKKVLIVTGMMMALFMAGPVMNNSVVDTMTGTVTAYAAESATFSSYWFQDSNGTWKVKDNNGNVVKNAWLCDDAVASNGQNVWYLLDSNGNMISAGLVQDGTGNYYSLEMNHNGYYGMLRYKSGNYDGVYLDLESSHGGSFAKVKNQDGIEALKAKYGVTSVSIDNSNCVYTSSFGSSGGSSGGSVSNPSPAGGNGGQQQSTNTSSGQNSTSYGTVANDGSLWVTDSTGWKAGDGTGLGSLH